MKLAHGLQITAVAAACAATALPSALAGGEPKNGTPFTRLAGNGYGYGTVYAPHQISRLATSTTTAEPKNEWPFTRAVHVNG